MSGSVPKLSIYRFPGEPDIIFLDVWEQAHVRFLRVNVVTGTIIFEMPIERGTGYYLYQPSCVEVMDLLRALRNYEPLGTVMALRAAIRHTLEVLEEIYLL